MTHDLSDALLEDALAAMQEGRALDPAQLAARHPGREAEALRLVRVVASLREPARAAARSGALEAGDSIGDFEIVEPAESPEVSDSPDWIEPSANRGPGRRYRAQQLSLGSREVVLDVLPARELGAGGLVRLSSEGVALASLSHPSLEEVCGFGEDGDLAFFATRPVNGVALRALLEELRERRGSALPGHAEIRRVVQWTVEVAEALALVHARGLVHGGIGPSTIVVRGASLDGGSPAGTAVLTGFGLARAARLETATRAQDVFALGAMLRAALDPIRRALDRDLAAVVARAAHSEAGARYADAGELCSDLRAWLAGRTVLARERPLHERLRRRLFEQRARVARAVLVGALAVLAVLALERGRHLVRAAGRLRAALADADAAAALERAGELPRAFDAFLAAPERSLARRIRGPAARDPLHPILEGLRAGDRGAALSAAASHLRAAGAGADPWIQRLFERALRELVRDPEADPTLRAGALRLNARLAQERPCVTPAELEAGAERRELAREAWQDAALPEIDRLHGLAALAGLGAAGDLAPVLAVLDPAPATPADAERVRLGLAVAEWIVRRARAGGADVDFAAASSSFGPHLERSLEGDAEAWAGREPRGALALRTGALLAVLAYAERDRTGEPSSLIAFVPEPWVRALDGEGSDGVHALVLLAQLGHPRAREVVSQGPWPRGGRAASFRAWGSDAVLAGDGAFVQEVRRRCAALAAREASPAALVAEFEVGVEHGSRFRAGLERIDPLLPEPEALRGYDPPPGEPAMRADVLRGDRCVDDQGRDCLSLRSPGSSRIELELALDSSPRAPGARPAGAGRGPGPRPILGLVHCAVPRDAMPFAGLAFVDVHVNGLPVCERLWVPGRATDPRSVHELELAADTLRPGANHVTLRLHPDATTSYRLYAAELDWRE